MSSSSSPGYDVSSSSSSSESSSSWTDSPSSESSSFSSMSSDWDYYSQFVRMNPHRTLQRVRIGFLLDLCLPDQQYVLAGPPISFATWGMFAGQQIAGRDVQIQDGLRVVVDFPRQHPLVEDQIVAAWYDAMMSRVRAALGQARSEGAYLVDIPYQQYRLI